MPRHSIIALVGPSGSGKTTLMVNLLEKFPQTVFPIKVCTNRPKRGPEDALFCRFMSADDIRAKRDNGELAQYLEYGGNIYGCARADIDAAVSKGIGIQAYVESGIQDLRSAGYTVLPVKVVSDSMTYRGDTKRKAEDAEREKTPLLFDLILHNSFGEGGLEHALGDLERFVRSYA